MASVEGLHYSTLSWEQIRDRGLGGIQRPLTVMHTSWPDLDRTAEKLARFHGVERLTLCSLTYNSDDVDRRHSRCVACRRGEPDGSQHSGFALLRSFAHIPPDQIQLLRIVDISGTQQGAEPSQATS